mmetsp:Transcript_48003/g.102540  ORF Transcript_48003/g.102540 Transcript_48003/m.102540 type:complete len:252 (-) Transcript_48003:454-1209(-)
MFRLRVGAIRAAAIGAAAVAAVELRSPAGAAGAPNPASRGSAYADAAQVGYAAPALAESKPGHGAFDTWRDSLCNQLGANCERDIEAELEEFIGARADRQFLWQTLRTDRAIRQTAIWLQVDEATGKPPATGRARVLALVEVGDALNGHVGIVHGGFTAALLDDVLGQATVHEARVQGIRGAPLTASLTIKYRRPVFADDVFLVDARVETITRRDKPGPPSWDVNLAATIVDNDGNTLVEATSRYVLKQFN